MTHATFHFDYSDLNVDLKQIENVLGYGEGDDREIVNNVVKDLLNEPGLFRQIRAEYIIYDNIEFVSSDKSLNINGINFNINKILFGQLKKAGSLAVFLCTAGEDIGIRSRKAMSDGDPLTGYIYDITGSIIVDAATDLMQGELEKQISAQGKKITNRYSPGYCGWDVSEQHKLFRLVPDNFCGIKLTESALMDPVKSVSGIIGIGPDVRYNPYRCSLCDMKDCAYRELKGR
ncbi:MAG: methionine synthase [Bacteroidales bacterium]|nr:methionine synthase [Bacteroidales bacterium]